MPQRGTRAYLYFPDCYGQEALAVGNIRTNGGAPCFGDTQDRGLVTEHGKQIRLGTDILCLEGGRMAGMQHAVLGMGSLRLQAGEGNLVLRAGEGISVQAPRVTVRTPLAINQSRTGQKRGKNPATGGGGTSISSQYEFSISSPLGALVGTAYEEYNPFDDGIAYESYEAVQKRRLSGLLCGIATALAIGALVAVVAATGGIVAAPVALAVGAVVAGVGCAASAVTYMRDEKNSTASSALTYVNNAGRAALTTLGIILMFWIAPYAAEAVTMEVTQGLPLTVLFGNVVTFEGLAEWALIGTEGAALTNAFFQTNELLMFFGDTKELGAPTGCDGYDDLKMLVEGYNTQLFFIGFEQWRKGKALQTHLNQTRNQGTGKYNEEEIKKILDDVKGDGFKNNPLRQAYENEVKALKVYGEELLSSGMPEEQVAKMLIRRDGIWALSIRI